MLTPISWTFVCIIESYPPPVILLLKSYRQIQVSVRTKLLNLNYGVYPKSGNQTFLAITLFRHNYTLDILRRVLVFRGDCVTPKKILLVKESKLLTV